MPLPSPLGFRSGRVGTHNTRSLMFDDLARLLEAVPADAPRQAYRDVSTEENLLGKATDSTRRYGVQRLAELYGLDPALPVFRAFRYYWDQDRGDGRPLLAFLLAFARDPILRTTAPCVLALEEGAPFDKSCIERRFETTEPGRFSEVSRAKISRLAGSSWTQAGFLEGRTRKRRQRPVVTPEAVAYALLLGYLTGVRGEAVLHTEWADLLDLPVALRRERAREAARRGLITVHDAGGILDVHFRGVLTPDELRLLDEPA